MAEQTRQFKTLERITQKTFCIMDTKIHLKIEKIKTEIKKISLIENPYVVFAYGQSARAVHYLLLTILGIGGDNSVITI